MPGSPSASDPRPEVGIDVTPRLLSDALHRVLSHEGWTVIDLREEPDRRVDIVLVTEEAGRQRAQAQETPVIVLPGRGGAGPSNRAGSGAPSDGARNTLSTDGDQLEQLLARLASELL